MKWLTYTALIALALSGCTERQIPTPTLSQDLSVAPEGQAPSIPLSPIALETQKDFDDFEMKSVGVLGIDGLIDVFRALSQDAKPGERPQDALLLLRLALLELRSESGDNNLQRAIAIAEQLNQEAPDSPHSTYLADDALLQEHQASWSGLNGEVELASEGAAEHTVELGESGSRLEGARAALAVLVTVGVEVGR